MKKCLAVMALGLLASSAWGEAKPAGFMLGAGVSFDTSNFGDEIEDELDRTGPGYSVDDDGAATGQDIYLGYAFGGASSLRLGYKWFGTQEGEVHQYGVKTGEYEVDADGVYVAADLLFPLSETFFLGGTLGIQNWDGEVTARNPVSSTKSSSDGRDFFYGVRAKLLFNEKRGGVVIGYNRYSFEDESGDDLEYDSLQIGLEGYFY
ncbi:outer membrane beta-barrel protein [Alcanivorax sp.]|jgi:hypothetical protein|uniref:outer membrane beta-barrel protein n=1 Tax=Alcanivorax sp. TaxID=1872427 RepID=UPI0032D8CA28